MPDRAQWVRTALCELSCVASHLLWLGVHLMDAGATALQMCVFTGYQRAGLSGGTCIASGDDSSWTVTAWLPAASEASKGKVS